MNILDKFCADSEGYIKNLLDGGIDISFCEYRDPDTGCIIPRDKRPTICIKHYCAGNGTVVKYPNYQLCSLPSFPTKYWDRYGIDPRLPRVNGILNGYHITVKCPYCGEEETFYYYPHHRYYSPVIERSKCGKLFAVEVI